MRPDVSRQRTVYLDVSRFNRALSLSTRQYFDENTGTQTDFKCSLNVGIFHVLTHVNRDTLHPHQPIKNGESMPARIRGGHA